MEASLYAKLDGGAVRCTACARYCEMAAGQTGLCGVRTNEAGRLNLDVYGMVIAGSVDPIEKKPLVHYRPGSGVYSIATTGCNWLCGYCQNHEISQRRKVEGEPMTPLEVAQAAVRRGAEGIAYTYNEPSIFIEFARDCGLEAKKAGLYNVFVSNGYDTPESVRMMDEFLDCITVDFKGSAEPGFMRRHVGVPDPAPIFETLREIRDKTSIRIEITDLIIPEVGQSLEYAEKLCRFVHDELGPDTPVHFLQFHPDYKMLKFGPTPVKTLERHHAVAKRAGIRYAYVGNVPGHRFESTYCPGCGKIAVQRYGFGIEAWNLDHRNRCAACGNAIPIKGRPAQLKRNRLHVIR